MPRTATRNGRRATGSALEQFLAQNQSRIARLTAIQKEQLELNARQEALQKETAALMGGGTFAPVADKPQRRVGRKATKKVARKGNGAKAVARKPRAAKATGNGSTKLTTHDALLQTLPTNDQDPISKDEATARVAKLGLKRSKVVIGQTLGASSHFQNPSRGVWRLSASGVKARDKSASTDAAPPPVAADSAPVSTPAPVAPTVAEPSADANATGATA